MKNSKCEQSRFQYSMDYWQSDWCIGTGKMWATLHYCSSLTIPNSSTTCTDMSNPTDFTSLQCWHKDTVLTKLQLSLLYTYIPSFFQLIPVLLEYKIPQQVTKVAIVCSCFLHITAEKFWIIITRSDHRSQTSTQNNDCHLAHTVNSIQLLYMHGISYKKPFFFLS